ncbi:MAG: type I methionyl aminopeptidase [Firmicutes bacterium]|nr:type I methionyl aminopeptidase [Bacillota bacterium]
MIIKNETEFNGMKEICRIVAIILQRMGQAIKPGITTGELDQIGHDLLNNYGARSAPMVCYNFPGYTCISVNEEVAHGIPGSRIICKGDTVNIDVSAVIDGFFGDTAATFAVPPVKASTQKLLNCAKQALHKACSAAQTNLPLNGIGLAVEKEAHKHGYTTIRNLCGHGVGLTLHDAPEGINNFFDKKDKRLLQWGMALAIEPFISEKEQYVQELADGWTLKTPHDSAVAQFEHTVVVMDGKSQILTLPY